MKSLLKRYLPQESIKFLSYLKNWNHKIYSLRDDINFETNLSDFFIWSNDCCQIEFIAENLRSLITGKKIEVTHNFIFFNEEGEFITSQKYQSSNFFEKIIIESPFQNTKSKYFSFIHFVESKKSLNEIFDNLGLKELNDICEQNRGYTVYYPEENKYSGAVVHGNFGGISKNFLKRAKTNLRKHIYTPIYKFEEGEIYDLVFNNPTNINLFIKIIFNDSNKIIHLNIPSLGTKYFSLSNYSGSISFESKLAICRALIFKNPAPNYKGTFDVFHS